jgi:hypothetical protein
MLGVTGAALDAAVRNGCPRLGDGSYDVAAVVEWLRKRDADRAARTAGGSDPDLRRWRSARADREQLRLDLDREKLIPKAAVEARSVRQILAVKQRLVNLCRKMGTKLMHAASPDAIEEELLREIRDICNDFARGLEAGQQQTDDVAMGAAQPADIEDLKTDNPLVNATGTNPNESEEQP